MPLLDPALQKAALVLSNEVNAHLKFEVPFVSVNWEKGVLRLQCPNTRQKISIQQEFHRNFNLWETCKENRKKVLRIASENIFPTPRVTQLLHIIESYGNFAFSLVHINIKLAKVADKVTQQLSL